MSKIVLWLLAAYRYVISPMIGPVCRFYPSCAQYAQEAIERHGFVRGIWLTTRRVLRCNPWHCGGHDPVP